MTHATTRPAARHPEAPVTTTPDPTTDFKRLKAELDSMKAAYMSGSRSVTYEVLHAHAQKTADAANEAQKAIAAKFNKKHIKPITAAGLLR